MYLSVMFSLNTFTKQTTQGVVQCISCSLSVSFRGYDRSHSISCSLSFLISRENNENGTIINKTFDRFDSGKTFHGHLLADSENIFGRLFQENPANLACKINIIKNRK